MTKYQTDRLNSFAYKKALIAVAGATDGSACIPYNNILRYWQKRYQERDMNQANVAVTPAAGKRCQRCRKYSTMVGKHTIMDATGDPYDDICYPCAVVVAQFEDEHGLVPRQP